MTDFTEDSGYEIALRWLYTLLARQRAREAKVASQVG